MPKRFPQDRLSFVADCIALRMNAADIAEKCAEKFGVSLRQARNYVRYVWDDWAAGELDERMTRKSGMRRTLETFYRRALAGTEYTDAEGVTRRRGPNYNAALNALRELCKIDGLYAPEQLHIVGADQMTPEQAQAEIARTVEQAKRLGIEIPTTDAPVNGEHGPNGTSKPSNGA